MSADLAAAKTRGNEAFDRYNELKVEHDSLLSQTADPVDKSVLLAAEKARDSALAEMEVLFHNYIPSIY